MLQLQNCVFVCIAPAVGVQSLMDATALISGSANYHIVQLNTFSNHLCSISCSCGIISPFTSLEPGSDSNVSTWWFHQLVECAVTRWCNTTGARSGDHHTVYPVVTKWCTTGATESQVVIIGGETGEPWATLILMHYHRHLLLLLLPFISACVYNKTFIMQLVSYPPLIGDTTCTCTCPPDSYALPPLPPA